MHLHPATLPASRQLSAIPTQKPGPELHQSEQPGECPDRLDCDQRRHQRRGAQDGYIGSQINTLNSVSQVLGTQQEKRDRRAERGAGHRLCVSHFGKCPSLKSSARPASAALAQANTMQQEVTKLLQ